MRTLLGALALGMSFGGAAIAATGSNGQEKISQANPAEGHHEGLGKVIHIDRDKGQIVISHGPIEGVMDGMTTGFGIANPALLDGVMADDGVRFILRAEDMTIVGLALDPAGKMAATGGGMAMGEGGMMKMGAGGAMGSMVGAWMPSYSFMHMRMEGTRSGTSTVDTETIVTTTPNRFFGITGQPATLRIVPLSMDVNTHMFGLMHAPLDWLSIMAMTKYIEKSMPHVTFAGGGTGTVRLGEFTVASRGLGDTELNTSSRVYNEGRNKLLMNFGVSLPTGSITRTGQILLPTGAQPIVRLSYAMQLGSGSFDLLPGLTYTGGVGGVGWGATYKGTFRTHENGQGYTLGDLHHMSGWASYDFIPEIKGTIRLAGKIDTGISGIDPNIGGAVQAADPDNYGSDQVDIGFGLDLMGREDGLMGQSLGIEFAAPLYRDLNGPQLETDWSLSARIKMMF